MQYAGSRSPLRDRLLKVLPSGLLAVSALILAFAISCDNDTTGPEPLVRESVGKASGLNAYVAIVVLKGASAGPTEVIGYICNGPTGLGPGGPAEFFQGLATANAVDLRSEDGDARLRATLSNSGVEGTIELAGGTTLTFTTSSAAGANPAGFYMLSLYADGQQLGNSWGGKRIEFQSFADGTSKGRVILPDGSELSLQYPATRGVTVTTTGQSRTIVLPDGTARGSRTKNTGGTNVPFVILFLFD